MKLHKEPTFADTVCDIRARKIKKRFFTQINTLIDWNKIENLINEDYSKGKSVVGKPSYNGLLLLKCAFYKAGMG